MTEKELEEFLVEVLSLLMDEEGLAEMMEDKDFGLKSITTFENAGVLTRNSGVILRFRSKLDKDIDKEDVEFQLTIVRSK